MIDVGRLTSIERFIHEWLSREPLMVSKPVGVWTAWCVGVGTQDYPEDATWQAVFEIRGCIVIAIAMVDDKSLERNNRTRSKGREGELAYPVT